MNTPIDIEELEKKANEAIAASEDHALVINPKTILALCARVKRADKDLAEAADQLRDAANLMDLLVHDERDSLREKLAKAEAAMKQSIAKADDYGDSGLSRPIRDYFAELRGAT